VSSVDSKSDFSNSISDESVKETTISTDGEESGLVPEIPSLQSEQISPNYGKGVVFYVKDRRIVGILLFNLFNRVNLAKAVLREGRGVDEISQCVRLFNVEEVA
jgi:apoptosis-inducing factor 1